MIIMQPWLWWVNGAMWLVAIGFIGIGIWRLIGAFKSLGLVELDREISTWEKILEHYGRILPRMKKGGQPAKTSAELLDYAGMRIEQLKLDRLRKTVKHPERAGGEVGETRAIRDIALSAAFFAIAGVFVGGSAVLIALFMG